MCRYCYVRYSLKTCTVHIYEIKLLNAKSDEVKKITQDNKTLIINALKALENHYLVFSINGQVQVFSNCLNSLPFTTFCK